MRIRFAILISCFAFLCGHAQRYTIKIYKNPEAYKAHQPDSIANIALKHGWQPATFQFIASRAAEREKIGNAWGIGLDSTLFVNCSVVFPFNDNPFSKMSRFNIGGFALVLAETKRYIFFNAPESLACCMGDVYAIHTKKGNIFPYILDKEKNETHYLNRGVMRNIVERLDPQTDSTMIRKLNQIIERD